eukprot:7607367-Heterocapsa_arctica.AAC.1
MPSLADRSPRPSLRPVLQLAAPPCPRRSSSLITSPTTSSSFFALSLIGSTSLHQPRRSSRNIPRLGSRINHSRTPR